jgi:hypothetical protein
MALINTRDDFFHPNNSSKTLQTTNQHFQVTYQEDRGRSVPWSFSICRACSTARGSKSPSPPATKLNKSKLKRPQKCQHLLVTFPERYAK